MGLTKIYCVAKIEKEKKKERMLVGFHVFATTSGKKTLINPLLPYRQSRTHFYCSYFSSTSSSSGGQKL